MAYTVCLNAMFFYVCRNVCIKEQQATEAAAMPEVRRQIGTCFILLLHIQLCHIPSYTDCM